jgi:hypothetical protein
MSRSGYSDDGGTELYRANIDRALKGKRGQDFLKELVKALDALPNKRLIAGDLSREGEVCAIGALGLYKNIDIVDIDPEDPQRVAKMFNVSESMAREVVFENDEATYTIETPEARWQRMRNWAVALIK